MDRNRVIRIMPAWEKRHAKPLALFRVAVGIWLLGLTAVLIAYHRAGWWPALLVPAALAHIYWAHLLLRIGDERRPPPGATA